MKQFGIRIAEPETRAEPAAPPPPVPTPKLPPRRPALSVRPVLLGCVAGLCLATGYLATLPAAHVARSTLLIEEAAGSPGQAPDPAALATAAEVIRSHALAAAVLDRVGPVAAARLADPPAHGLRALLPADDPAPDPRRSAVRRLAATVEVSPLGASGVLAIDYRDDDPALAASVADAYAEAFVADRLDAHANAEETALRHLLARLSALQSAAREAALAAEIFRTENGLVSTREPVTGGATLARLNEELAAVTIEAGRAQALMREYDAILAAGASALLAREVWPERGRERLTGMQDQLTALSARLNRIEQDFGREHPQAERLREQVETQANLLLDEVRRLLGEAGATHAAANARVQALRDNLGLAIDVKTEAGRKQLDLRALEERAETLGRLHDSLQERLARVEARPGPTPAEVRVLDRAEATRRAAPAGAFPTLAGMGGLGLLGGAGFALLRGWRGRFLRTGAEVEDDLGQRFLGHLPHLDDEGATPAPVRPAGADLRGGTELPVLLKPIHALQHPRSAYAATLGGIRLALELSLAGRTQIALGVTSARRGEGASTVSLNLAAVLAAAGGSVLLIDCDPASAGLSRRSGLVRGEGLVEAVLGRGDWTRMLRSIADSGVHLLPCISEAPITHPAEMFGSKGMRQLLASARARYSHVVLDLPPLGPGAEARVMLRMLDQAVLVAARGRTRKSDLRDALAQDAALSEKILGIVLNDADPQGPTPTPDAAA